MAPGLRKAPAAVKELKKQHDKTIEKNQVITVFHYFSVHRSLFNNLKHCGRTYY